MYLVARRKKFQVQLDEDHGARRECSDAIDGRIYLRHMMVSLITSSFGPAAMLPREDHVEQDSMIKSKGDSDITANDSLEEISALGSETPGPTART